MPHDLAHRLEELKHEIERQDEQWAEVETQLRSLSRRRVAVSRDVIADIDAAFATPSRPAVFLQHKFC
jgi:hypothetical protein